MSESDRHAARDDDALEEELRALVGRMDPVPDQVMFGGRGAFAWRDIDEELAALAELTHDSLLEDDVAMAGVRGESGPRTLTFESPVLALEVEVTGTGGAARRLVGQLVPPSRAEVFVEHRMGVGARPAGTADELGRFVIEAVAPGDMRLRFTLADGTEVRTPWTRL